jgi:hypothetical protein
VWTVLAFAASFMVMRIRIGDVFRVMGARIQPVTLPVDAEAACREVSELAEKNRGVITDAAYAQARYREQSKGGEAKKGFRKESRFSDDQLRAQVDEYVAAGETLTHARQRVHEDTKIPFGTVRSRTTR